MNDQLRPIDYSGHIGSPMETSGTSAQQPVRDAIQLAYESGRTQGRLDALTGSIAGRLDAIEKRLDERDAADRRMLADGVRDLEETIRELVKGRGEK